MKLVNGAHWSICSWGFKSIDAISQDTCLPAGIEVVTDSFPPLLNEVIQPVESYHVLLRLLCYKVIFCKTSYIWTHWHVLCDAGDVESIGI